MLKSFWPCQIQKYPDKLLARVRAVVVVIKAEIQMNAIPSLSFDI